MSAEPFLIHPVLAARVDSTRVDAMRQAIQNGCQMVRSDAVGELARVVVADRRFPVYGRNSRETFHAYLSKRGASADVHQALVLAWDEWQQYRLMVTPSFLRFLTGDSAPSEASAHEPLAERVESP